MKNIHCNCVEHGRNDFLQPYFHCYTCGLIDGMGCCVNCAMTCHKGHILEYHRPSNFYCDCYYSGNCLYNKEQTFVPEQEQEQEQEEHLPEVDQMEGLPFEIALMQRMERRYLVGPDGQPNNQNDDEPRLTTRDLLMHRGNRRNLPVRPNPGQFGLGASMFRNPGNSPFANHGNPGNSPFENHGNPGNHGPSLFGNPQISKFDFVENVKQNCPNPDSLLEMVKSMDEIEISESAILQNRLTQDITTIDIKNMQIQKKVPYLSVSSSNLKVSLPQNAQTIRALGGLSTWGRSIRMNNKRLPIVSVLDGVLVADGKSVKLLKNMEVISRLDLSSQISYLAASNLDPNIVAAGSFDVVYVLYVDETGINRTHTVQLMTSELDFSLISLEWIPNMPMLLAVTSNKFVKIYNIPDDCLSPMICLLPRDRMINSCTFIVDNETPVAVISSMDGSMAKVQITQDMNGPKNFMFSNPSFGSSSLNLSSLVYSNLIFISSENSLTIARPDDFDNCCKINCQELYQYFTTVPHHENIFVFTSKKSIMTVEIADDKVITTTIHENNVAGIASDGEKLIVVLEDGTIGTLAEGEPKLISRPNIPNKSDNFPEEVVEVPLTFWTNSTYKNGRGSVIINDTVKFTDSINVKNYLSLILKADEGLKVIGFILSKQSFDDVTIVVKNRKVTFPFNNDGQKDIMFPLKQNECGKTVKVEIFVSKIISIREIKVFCADVQTKEENFDENMNISRNIIMGSSEKSSQGVVAEICADALPLGVKIPTNEMFNLAYKSKKVSTAAQTILAKSDIKKEEINKSEHEILKSGVPPNPKLWRDVAILCMEGENEVPKEIWNGDKTMHSMFVAFMSK
ncbi:hypothetical protein TVAG_014890 [Trichomonas vaginalis G3]|uniref:UBR-type domain-containing protein n=1 Tax=Trichomonas vaginalis (strain ATCC PRA-98 / G3) TaxID=412133 RepID=A2FG58_TRIV3|nr:perineurial glial growth protein family [Trichomonas vaginalis G3]EAX96097.1 hypothetical protein TVAG_014890 [Trichomonas vaginalis G3]KAI5500069.1 perineurial glial growth protein family [Trichomonas vaginalis G3]|eukprot:XP_001309027.1 hypothetical protein [Trichomonas vaginalis G3]